MPSTTYTHEEFSLATIGGVDAGLVNVALELHYERNGSWLIENAGFITGWKRYDQKYGHHVPAEPIVAWIADTKLLPLILERARTKYSADIDEHVFACCGEDDSLRMWGAA